MSQYSDHFYVLTDEEASDLQNDNELSESQKSVMQDFDKAAINRNRAETRRHCSLTFYESYIGPDMAPYFSYEPDYLDPDAQKKKERLGHLHEALSSLPADDRAFLLDLVCRGVNEAVIAERDNVSVSTVSRRKKKILAELRKYFD